MQSPWNTENEPPSELAADGEPQWRTPVASIAAMRWGRRPRTAWARRGALAVPTPRWARPPVIAPALEPLSRAPMWDRGMRMHRDALPTRPGWMAQGEQPPPPPAGSGFDVPKEPFGGGSVGIPPRTRPAPCTALPTRWQYLQARCCRRDECTDTTQTFRGATSDMGWGNITIKYPMRAPSWRGLRVNDCAGACEDPTEGVDFDAGGDIDLGVDLDAVKAGAAGTLVRPSRRRFPLRADVCLNCDVPRLTPEAAPLSLDEAWEAVNARWSLIAPSARTFLPIRPPINTDPVVDRAEDTTRSLAQTAVATLTANSDLVAAALCIVAQTSDRRGYGSEWQAKVRSINRALRNPASTLNLEWEQAGSDAAIYRDLVVGRKGRFWPNTTLYWNTMHPYSRMLAVIHGTGDVPVTGDRLAAGKAMSAYLFLGVMNAWGLINDPIYPYSSGRCRAAIRAMNTYWWMLNERYPNAPGTCGAPGPGAMNRICLYNSDYLHMMPAAHRRGSNCPVDDAIYLRDNTHWNRVLPPRTDPGWRIAKERARAGLPADGGCCWPPMIEPTPERTGPGGVLNADPGYLYVIPTCDQRI